MVIVGVEIARYRLADTVLSILNRLNLPWATTCCLNPFCPNSIQFLGSSKEKAPAALKSKIQTADLILALGAVFGSGARQPDDPPVRQDDPDLGRHPRQPGRRHSPCTPRRSSLHSTPRAPSDGPAGSRRPAPAAAAAERRTRRKRGDGDRGAEIALAAAEPAASPTPIATGLTYQELFDTLAEPAFWDTSMSLIADTYLGIYPAARMTMPAQNSFMADAIWASIGHSVAAAVGAAIPGEKRPVVVCGDGGFQMTGQALATMVRMRQNTIVIVVDNGLYGYEQYLLGRSYYNSQTEAPLPYAVLAPCDYEGFARAMGVGQVSGADSVATLRTALASAKAHSTGPSFIHALVKSRVPPARAVSGRRADTLGPVNLDGNQASIREAVDSGLLAGAVTLVWQSGKLLQVNEIGYRDVEARLPMQRDTLFRIASMTKPVTVAAAMALLEEGKFALTDPVTKWLPELADMRVLSSRQARWTRRSRRGGRSRSTI